MSELFEKSLRTLELPRVLEMLSAQAVSDEAKRRCLALRPETDIEDVERLQEETEAARRMMALRGSPGFSGVKPVREILDRADRGGCLSTIELLTVAGLLTSARRTRDYFNDKAGEKSAIDHLFHSLHGNRFLEEKIKSAILDEDTIADTASPELADIRRHMRQAQAKSRQILQKIISSPSYSKILQESLITQRDGRFVVPVKAECKADMPGLIHDISSSGATVFVEPMGVVQANNELIELQGKEKKEIQRILAQLSANAAAHKDDIGWDYDALVLLDCIFARAELSYRMEGIRPEIRHCCNSGAAILYPEFALDMVRPGIITYGNAPSEELEGAISLRPMMSLHSMIAQVRTVPTGTDISYGRLYRTTHDTRVAVLPIGYADGLSRLLTGKASFYLQGKLVPVIGRICMDMCMLDVSEVPDAKPGDIVTIFGYDDDGTLVPCERLAAAQGTINYELLCQISKRIPRICHRGAETSQILQYIV